MMLRLHQFKFYCICRCEPFEEGDSGSLIYMISNGKALAIGILRGFCPTETDVYEAIVLNAAIEEIQQDYRHLVGNLRLLTPNE